MRLLVTTLLVAASLVASQPAPAAGSELAERQPTPEPVQISDFLVRYPAGKPSQPTYVWFVLKNTYDGTSTSCTANQPAIDFNVVHNCGKSQYRFALGKGYSTEWGVKIFHQAEINTSGKSDVPTKCPTTGQAETSCNQSGGLVSFNLR